MAISTQQILDALAKLPTPRGMPLPQAGVLSEISVTDGKVFFSIGVDAAEARDWEDVRSRAEAAVRGIPGVSSAMVALTAERKPGSGPGGQRPADRGGVAPVSSHRPHGGAGAISNGQAGRNSRH